jgi:hypothetical protein
VTKRFATIADTIRHKSTQEDRMRLNLDLEGLHVETTVMQPEDTDLEGFDGGYVASILWDTQTRPIQRPNTNSSPCVA